MTPHPADHRARVGHARREKMRERLIEAATLVFAEIGPEAQIEDVVRQAGVSRGTFYNYFRSTEELLHAAVDALASEMVVIVGAACDEAAAPPEQFADGLKAFADLAIRHPLLLEFIGRLGLRTLGAGVLVPALSGETLAPAIAPEARDNLPPRLAMDMVEAAMVALLLRLRAGAEVDMTGVVAALLRLLGHPRTAAARIALRPAPMLEVPDDSLIRRSEAALGLSS